MVYEVLSKSKCMKKHNTTSKAALPKGYNGFDLAATTWDRYQVSPKKIGQFLSVLASCVRFTKCHNHRKCLKNRITDVKQNTKVPTFTIHLDVTSTGVLTHTFELKLLFF